MRKSIQKIKRLIIEHKKIIIFMAITFIISTTLFILYPWILKEIKQTPLLSNIYYFIQEQLKERSIIWLFIITFIGSIFIFSMPVELSFVYYIITGANVFLSIIAATLGTISGRCVNFFIGSKFKYLTAHLKEKDARFQKKFNNTNTSLIFFGNFLPAFPVEHFAVFIGTTHYSFIKFLKYQLAGKLLKLTIMAIFIKLLFWNLDLLNVSFYDLTKTFIKWVLDIVLT